MLKGKKTYIMGGVTIIAAVAAFLVGDADIGTTVNLVVSAALAMFIRDGINTAVAGK